MERWLSGRKHRSRKAAGAKVPRGFESLPFRQQYLVSDLCGNLYVPTYFRFKYFSFSSKSEVCILQRIFSSNLFALFRTAQVRRWRFEYRKPLNISKIRHLIFSLNTAQILSLAVHAYRHDSKVLRRKLETLSSNFDLNFETFSFSWMSSAHDDAKNVPSRENPRPRRMFL